jgi:hypothetical protein
MVDCNRERDAPDEEKELASICLEKPLLAPSQTKGFSPGTFVQMQMPRGRVIHLAIVDVVEAPLHKQPERGHRHPR